MVGATRARRRRREGRTKSASPYRWRLTALGLLFAGIMLALQLFGSADPSRNTVLNRINAVWYDLRFQLWPPERDARIPIVIVDLDEATQQREGRWPWDRRKVAQLIHALNDQGAALIGFDVVFSEPAANPVRQILDSAALPAPVDRALTFLIDEFDGDAALGRALSDNTVLGYFLHADGGKAGVLPPPFLELSPDKAAQSTLIAMPDYTASLPVLMHSALASGFVVAVPDADGIVRRMPLVMRHDTGVYASLSLEMSRLALAAPWIRLGQAAHGDTTAVTHVQIGPHLRVPLDEYGNLLVPYRGPAQAFPTLSATGVLRGDAPAQSLDQLDGAIVLVGSSALGLSDLRTIPLQTGYPGVEVHANVIDTMLHAALHQAQARTRPGADSSTYPKVIGRGSPLYVQPDWEAGASLVLLLLTGVLLGLGLPGRTPFMMLVLTASWLAVVVSFNILLWQVWHIAFPLALQALAILGLGALNIAGGYVGVNRQKRTIQRLFGEYVPSDHVERMLERPGQISLEGEQRTMTVLFADVRNFTALSESLSATELKSVLNRYLSAITAVIFEHQGTIDKYVGDMVMAFWNAPLDDPHHATHAVRAALAMQLRMATLRDEFQREGLPIFHIGIGINTGPMNVGDMGSEYRRAYTVLGDAVNLASRLESLTDFYQVPVLVSDTTRKQAAGLLYRTVDRVRVKGRKQPLDISQPLDADQSNAGISGHLADHERAILDYRQRRWDEAAATFRELANQCSDDPIARLYINRIAEAKLETLSADWDGVYNHEAK